MGKLPNCQKKREKEGEKRGKRSMKSEIFDICSSILRMMSCEIVRVK
jgi:hypothetical protein